MKKEALNDQRLLEIAKVLKANKVGAEEIQGFLKRLIQIRAASNDGVTLGTIIDALTK